MSFFQIPTFIMKTPTWTDEDVKEHTRPLDICLDCHYVLCSCGGCHSQECQETCSYDTNESEASA